MILQRWVSKLWRLVCNSGAKRLRQKSVARACCLLFAAPQQRWNRSQKKHCPASGATLEGSRTAVAVYVAGQASFTPIRGANSLEHSLLQLNKNAKDRRRDWIRPCPEQRNVEIQFAVERVQRYIGTRSAAINVSVIRRCNRRGSHRTRMRCRERSRNIRAVNPGPKNPVVSTHWKIKEKSTVSLHTPPHIVSGKCDRADYVICGTHKEVSLCREHSESKQTYHSHNPFHRTPCAVAMNIGQFSAPGIS